jgi:uncharacterized protein (DUF302 family)
MKKIILAIFTLASFAFAGQGFVLLETSKGGKELIKAVSDAVMKAGFVPADERDLNVAYQKQFEQSDFELYYNLTVFDPKTLGQVLPSNPKLAGFVPYTLLIYQKKNDKKSYVGFVRTDAISLATGVKDKKVLLSLKKSESTLLKELKASLKDAKEAKLSYKASLRDDNELFFETAIKLKAADNAIAKKEALQKEFESTLEVEGFKISNITDVKTELEKVKADMSKYEFFETYSICKLKVIYNTSKERPEAGVFAPCSVFFYKLKNEPVIHVGFPPTKNWVVHTNVTNAEHIKIMQEAENVAKNMLKEAAE